MNQHRYLDFSDFPATMSRSSFFEVSTLPIGEGDHRWLLSIREKSSTLLHTKMS
jgi:hypothetical protein